MGTGFAHTATAVSQPWDQFRIARLDAKYPDALWYSYTGTHLTLARPAIFDVGEGDFCPLPRVGYWPLLPRPR